jgi:hypothetical protein
MTTSSSPRQAGFGAVSIVIIIVVLLLVAAAGVAVYKQSYTKTTDNNAAASEISRPSAKAPTSQPSNQPQASVSTRFDIPELHLTLTPKDNLKDLTYYVKSLKTDDGQAVNAAYFSTVKLEKADANCSAEFGPLGVIQVHPGQYDKRYGSLVKQFDNLYVTYQGSHASCMQSTDPAVHKKYSDSEADFRELLTTVERTN